MIKGESMSPPAMFDLGNSEATGTSRQFGLALIVCFLICEWQGLIGRGAGGQPRWHIHAEPFRRFQINYKFKFAGLQHSKSAGFAPLRIRTTKSLACRYAFSTDKSIS
jgi:hypothetical protein